MFYQFVKHHYKKISAWVFFYFISNHFLLQVVHETASSLDNNGLLLQVKNTSNRFPQTLEPLFKTTSTFLMALQA